MKLNKILVETFGAKQDQLIDSFSIYSFPEWDSMSYMFFITKLEEEYEIVISGNEIESMRTVKDVKNIILSKGKNIE
jgi:acyl carrier protein